MSIANLNGEKMSNRVDGIKLNHWLNVRKTSLDVLNKHLSSYINYQITFENLDQLDDHAINQIVKFLSIPKDFIQKSENIPAFIFSSKEQMQKTKRPIRRGGIHYYNYYTLPSPKGYVAPVLIDILCPKEKMPVLNNGHLEPAITVSLGPNDIYARFAKKINKTNFVKFRINPDPKTNWVVGSNYYEPSYCLHTYSRATDKPGKILSYTTKSNIESLFDSKLNSNSFKNLGKNIDAEKPNRSFLLQDILNRGYDLEAISKKTKISLKKMKKYFSKKSNLSLNDIKKICKIINTDSSFYIDKTYKEDKIGKYYYDYKDSLKTIRNFKSYKVASIACSARSPDLTGYFLKVDNKSEKNITDLIDSNCSHYLVTKGNLTFFSKENDQISKTKMKEGDSLWVSSYTEHGFSGSGALVKISDGQNFNYLEKIDITNTYNLKKTLTRGRKDKINWGYDVE
ncbi:MAG: hypothetical protein CMG02_00350 [Candidatus Marinimicrobia bacterium]|nr:hypothetical protein [Candidatus Neomarinimicrobiota bacterium]|tara:strand:- start:4455 stop:5816 length:1362 start_codon:yes stop_codon:yes gene_type:complete